ncbi:transposase InsO family protein [Burkholderia ambifaria]|nr:transposase InsO family protein [Burkholderia ambifaria]
MKAISEISRTKRVWAGRRYCRPISRPLWTARDTVQNDVSNSRLTKCGQRDEIDESRRGNCYDNAPIESFWGTLKNELVYHQRFATREQARLQSANTSKSSTTGNAHRPV